MADKYKRADKPYSYIAARLGGAFDPLPYWFRLLANTGMLRFDSEFNVEVQLITGAWDQVKEGDWVVVQRAEVNGPIGYERANIWHVEHEDFIKGWERVE